MRILVLTIAAALTPALASATGGHTPPPTPQFDQRFDLSSDATATANANASAIAQAGGGGGGGGGGGASLTDQSRANLYVFPPPAAAAPLPGTICPKGDSLAWSIGWGFFSYSVSSTRTELECLERWAALLKQTPHSHQAQAPVINWVGMVPYTPPPAAAPTPVPAASAAAAVAPEKKASAPVAKKRSTRVFPAPATCQDGTVPACTVKK